MRGMFFGTLLAILAFCPGVVLAETPDRNKYLVIGERAIIHSLACDTREQVEDVLRVHQRTGYQSAMAQIRVYNREENTKGRPKCSIADFDVIVLEKVSTHHDLADFGTLHVFRVRSYDKTKEHGFTHDDFFITAKKDAWDQRRESKI